MIYVDSFINLLKKNKIDFFTGVPDSVLKNLTIEFETLSKKKHIIAANEGSAVSTGIGYHLATKKRPCIYMQNSGLSNAINPLASIANESVYSIPLLLVIGWRGSPNIKDEAQHMVKGKITKNLLDLLKIKYCVLRKSVDLKKLDKLLKNNKNNIVACLVEKKTFNKKISIKPKISNRNSILRSDFIKNFLKLVPKNAKIVSTTGYTSRELYQIRKIGKIKTSQDFYMVGGMGHSASVALGYAIQSTKKIYCLDGDGSILMHLGSLANIGRIKNKNLKHVLLNNNSHESVGGQETFAENINFKLLSKSLGYNNYDLIENNKDIKKIIKKFMKKNGPSLLEVKIQSKSMQNLGRPENLIKLKNLFINK